MPLHKIGWGRGDLGQRGVGGGALTAEGQWGHRQGLQSCCGRELQACGHSHIFPYRERPSLALPDLDPELGVKLGRAGQEGGGSSPCSPWPSWGFRPPEH